MKPYGSRASKLFCKGPESTSFRLGGPHALCWVYSALQLERKCGHSRSVDKRMRPGSNKALLPHTNMQISHAFLTSQNILLVIFFPPIIYFKMWNLFLAHMLYRNRQRGRIWPVGCGLPSTDAISYNLIAPGVKENKVHAQEYGLRHLISKKRQR